MMGPYRKIQDSDAIEDGWVVVDDNDEIVAHLYTEMMADMLIVGLDKVVPIGSKFVQVLTVIDPDTKLPVELEIRKMETGPLVGLDGSFLEQDIGTVYSPYDYGVQIVDE